jgi:hypothetical protein
MKVWVLLRCSLIIAAVAAAASASAQSANANPNAGGNAGGKGMSVVVVDAAGALVGVPGGDGALIPARDGRAINAPLQFDGFGGMEPLFYLVPSCAGQPYVEEKPGLFAPVAAGAPGQTVYMATRGAAAAALTYYSSYEAGFGCSDNVGSFNLIPAVSTGVNLNRFTPPFSVQFR